MQLLLGAFLLLSVPSYCLRDFHIDYANQQFIRDGQPYRYISGSVHYFRTHPSQWEQRLQAVRAAGLNAIQTYIPWNFHNTYQNQYDFSGGKNFTHFFELAAKYDLAVLVRPGPYICAEWENGGLPFWLLNYPNISLRSSQTDFLREALAWWDVLLPILKPQLWNNGGPIIMAQIENEYGSYGCDKQYLNALRDKAQSLLGSSAVLYTTDPPEVIECGKIDNVFATVDFGERGDILADEYFGLQQKLNSGGPRVNSEYYPGWYVTWGDKGPYKDFTVNEVKGMTNVLWNHNASFNYYMFHGGTNFGFWNGMEYQGPLITSYDYWAPMHENGAAGPKYDAIRSYISNIPNWPNPPQTVPTIPAGITGNGLSVVKYGNWFDYENSLISQANCSFQSKTFEQLNQPFGFVKYTFNIGSSGQKLNGTGLKDFAFVYVNSQFKGALYPHFKHRKVESIDVNVKSGDTLVLYVENAGRITWETAKDPKGILTPLSIDGISISPAQSCSIQIDQLPAIVKKSSTISQAFTPGDVFVGQFSASKIADTNIDLQLWGKGIVWINGFNLGRYWSTTGPQKSLYVPSPILSSVNTIVILEQERIPTTCIGTVCKYNLLASAISYG